MIDERQEELAALHALGLLEGAEKTQFEATLSTDPELQALVRDLGEAAAALAHTAPAGTPPAELRERLLRAIASRPPQGARPVPDNVVAGSFGSVSRWAGWAAAACFLLLAGWVGQLYYSSRTETALLHQQQAIADLAIKSARNQLEAERIVNQRELADLGKRVTDYTQQLVDAQQKGTATLRELADAQQKLSAATRQLADSQDRLANLERSLAAARTQIADLGRDLKAQGDLANLIITTLASKLENTPQAQAVAVWNPAKQEGVLKVEKLPALAADKSYQLWVVDPQYPAPVDGGTFTVDPQTGVARIDFKAKQPVKAVAAFAVTLERKGGVPKAEGPFVLLGK